MILKRNSSSSSWGLSTRQNVPKRRGIPSLRYEHAANSVVCWKFHNVEIDILNQENKGFYPFLQHLSQFRVAGSEIFMPLKPLFLIPTQHVKKQSPWSKVISWCSCGFASDTQPFYLVIWETPEGWRLKSFLWGVIETLLVTLLNSVNTLYKYSMFSFKFILGRSYLTNFGISWLHFQDNIYHTCLMYF